MQGNEELTAYIPRGIESSEEGDRVRWQGALSRMQANKGIELPEEGDLEAALVSAGVADITISDILEAHDRWQEESPDDPDGIHDFVDKTWADKRARKVDVG